MTLGSLAVSTAAQAEELAASQPAHLYAGIGLFDVSDSQKDSAAVFDIGYIPDYNIIWEIRPLIGGFVNSKGAGYAHIGLSRSIFITDNFLARIQWGFGAYGEGNSMSLGQTFEFREQLELGWQFDGGDMVSAYFWHLSNAGISDTNPGVNAAGVYYSAAF